MNLQDQLHWVQHQRLEVTSPSIEAAERMAARQQHPQVTGQPLRQLTGAQAQVQPRFKQYRYRGPEELKQNKAKELTRDERFEIRVVKKYFPELSYIDIALKTGFTRAQVQTALTGPLTPKKKGIGGYKDLSSHELEALLKFLNADQSHREIPWGDLRFVVPEISQYGPIVISRTLKGLGFERPNPTQQKRL
ncbi:hypothetical protein F5Y00DRAFT_224163 [Daldinia vernicosa]|uniref:uncharacterized protein n=1 Tax=Daldinia vernicosa TaxID=114800 RepID=UPI002007B48B|nr:uncharacterized protein F5Y00DRAFT_224163 [Daldinia vernicosa]KAI0853986.1 hypothetical protein F5Y00DRAFT_224163 [Daldinia vernicosa]